MNQRNHVTLVIETIVCEAIQKLINKVDFFVPDRLLMNSVIEKYYINTHQ